MLYIQWHLSLLQSGQAPWDLTQFSQLPSAARSYFPESHWQSEICSLTTGILVWGKARSHRATHLGCSGAESPGWFDVLPKHSLWDVIVWVGALLWWSCQSPVTHSCDLLNHPNSFCRGMFKLSAKLDTDFVALLAQSFWMWQPHSTHAHPMASTALTD